MGSHYEISPRERADEMRRAYDEFDAPEETYEAYLARTTAVPEASLSKPPEAGSQAGLQSAGRSRQPGTGGSESRDTKEAA